MKFYMEVFSINIDGERGWHKIKPSGKKSKPYSYDTFEEAERMINMCYPNELWNKEKRITYEG